MIGENARKDICRRLGLMVKYMAQGHFFWNAKTECFCPRLGYSKYLVMMHHFNGCLFVVGLFAYGWKELKAEDIPEVDLDESLQQNQEGRMVGLLGGMMIGSLGFAIILINSVTIDHLDEILEFFNNSFGLCNQIQHKYLPGVTLPKEEENAKWLNYVVKISVHLTVVFSIVFCGVIFQPSNPMHILFVGIFEIPMTFSNVGCIFYTMLLCYGAFDFGTRVMVYAFIFLMDSLSVYYWFDSAMPVMNRMNPTFARKFVIPTARLGQVPAETLIGIYRTLQVLNSVVNNSLGTLRFSYHTIGCLVTTVVSAFVLIRYNHRFSFTNPTSALYVLLLILLTILPIFVYFQECIILNGMEERWQRFQGRLIRGTSRKSGVHKTARSFLPVTLRAGGSFYNVNNSTFLDWMNQTLDHLVNLLVSF